MKTTVILRCGDEAFPSVILVTAGQGLEHHKHVPILFFWKKVPGAPREAQWIMKALRKLYNRVLPRTQGAPLKR